jgi:hypothetical protein
MLPLILIWLACAIAGTASAPTTPAHNATTLRSFDILPPAEVSARAARLDAVSQPSGALLPNFLEAKRLS